MTNQQSLPTAPSFAESIQRRLASIYGSPPVGLGERIVQMAADFAVRMPASNRSGWDQGDVALITYGDQVQSADEAPLATLSRFLTEHEYDRLLSTVHILPFCPYSSDDGFSVIDYLQVDPALGDWSNVEQLGSHFRLMFDLVMNHASAQCEWFQKYLRGETPYNRFFIEADPSADLSAVVRPRSLPLLSPFDTSRGRRHVWTTFSADQVDLNYGEPELLLAMLQVLLEYAARGAQIIRLDAVGFLWKQIGTSCIHLPQTHSIVKLMRDVLATAAPHVWLLTETNVPHEENVSYFGDGDEAQIVYQFSLPPLLLDAFVHGDATYLMNWLQGLEPPQPGTTYLNFTASHDGIGVRPLEGLAPEQRLDSLVAAVKQRGGLVSTRRRGDRDVPYELNISYVDALTPSDANDEQHHARRFLATQAIMLAMQGIPAVYFQSLVGTRNDLAGVAETGQNRRINRRKFQWGDLQAQIADGQSLAGNIYHGYRRLLALRRNIAAFHPDAVQETLPTADRRLVAFQRRSLDGRQGVVVLANTGVESLAVNLEAAGAGNLRYDLISGESVGAAAAILKPGQAAWLAAGPIGE